MGLRNRKGPTDLGTFTTNTQSEMISSADFRTATLTLITTGFTGTIKVFASNADRVWIVPDLSVAASATNQHATVRSIDLENGDTIAWDTGVAYTTDTSVRRFEINDNNNTFAGVQTSLVTVWSIEVQIDFVDNE